jgi:hypothetical protein
MTNEHGIRSKIKSKLNNSNACHYSVHNFYLPILHLKQEIYKKININLLCVGVKIGFSLWGNIKNL